MKTPQLALSLLAALALPALAESKPAVTLTVTPEREAVHPKSSARTVLQVEVTAKPSSQKRTLPLNLALVLDKSGSMSGAKIERARQAAGVALDQLGPDDIFSMVVYDSEVSVLIEPQRVRGAKEKRALKRRIEAIEAGSNTALYGGVERGAEQLEKFLSEENVSRVVLLSDGLANEGPSSTEDLERLGERLLGRGISVSTIGLGDDYNEDLMTALAEASRANYYYVRDAERLPSIFEEELDSVQSLVARRVEIEIQLADGIKPVGVLGEEGLTFRDGALRIPLEDLTGSQSRRFLIECEVPEAAKDRADLATVSVEYEDADSGEQGSQRESAAVRIAATVEESDDSVQTKVISNRAVTSNRMAKERAVKLADAGRADEAAEVLRDQMSQNAALPAAAKSELIESEQSVLKDKAAELESTGSFGKASRKEIRYQNYLDKNQKR